MSTPAIDADLESANSSASSIQLAKQFASLIVYLGGLILNSLLLGAVVRVPLLYKTKLCWSLILLLICFIGTSVCRSSLHIIYLRWPLTYFCDSTDGDNDCTSVPSQLLGSLQYTFVVFTLVGNLFLCIDRHTRVIKSSEMSNKVVAVGLFVGSLFAAAFITLFSITPPSTPYFPKNQKVFIVVLAMLYVPVAVAITVLYYQIFRHVKKITRPQAAKDNNTNALTGILANLGTRITETGGGMPSSTRTLTFSITPTVIKRDPLEEYAHELSWAMTLTLAICYVPSLIYFGVRATGRDWLWLDFSAALIQALDTIISPILVLYFQRPYLQAFFEAYIEWMF
ncbi:hypothetical protein BDR26DRAFT_861346 [Obelidium mucronatum]|nr:hypothetical protein BDR26DRAFT_861346 [Obelidium mucronatum]